MTRYTCYYIADDCKLVTQTLLYMKDRAHLYQLISTIVHSVIKLSNEPYLLRSSTILFEKTYQLIPIKMASMLPTNLYRDVEFKTIDGLTLRGSIYPAASKGPAVVMTPGVSAPQVGTLALDFYIL